MVYLLEADASRTVQFCENATGWRPHTLQASTETALGRAELGGWEGAPNRGSRDQAGPVCP